MTSQQSDPVGCSLAMVTTHFLFNIFFLLVKIYIGPTIFKMGLTLILQNTREFQSIRECVGINVLENILLAFLIMHKLHFYLPQMLNHIPMTNSSD